MFSTDAFTTSVLDTADRRITLEGRRAVTSLGSPRVGIGGAYVRPSRVVVEEGGVERSYRIPDPALWRRAVLIAVMAGVWVVNRRST